jgi:hypothetical protein
LFLIFFLGVLCELCGELLVYFSIKLAAFLASGGAYLKKAKNELPCGKPRDTFKGKINFIAESCGELNPVDFASLLKLLE